MLDCSYCINCICSTRHELDLQLESSSGRKMPPKRARKPVSGVKPEKKRKLIVVEKASARQIQELERALEQSDNNSHVLHLVEQIAQTPNLPPDLTTRLLKFCIKVGSEDTLRQLLVNQAVDVSTREGGELLWTAVDKGQEEIALMLVRLGADLSVEKADDNSTLLHGVLKSYWIKNNAKREELVRLMLDRGADVNARDSRGNSVLHYAIMENHCSSLLVENLLEHGARVTTGIYSHRNDIYLALNNKMELLPRLVQHLVSDEETKNQRGAMAIRCLISKDCFGVELAAAMQMIKRILDLGVPANANDPFADDRRRHRAGPLLSRALDYKKKDAIKLLLDYGADPHQKDDSGDTPLFQATAFKGYTHASRWLIEKGASIHDRCDDGCYPIHGACLHNSLRNIHLFLGLGADLNVTNNRGFTPFSRTDDPFRFNDAHSLIIKHFALLIAKGKRVSDNDVAHAKLYVWGYHHFKKCAKQLELMKVENIFHNISYFSLLSKNMYSIMRYMKNPNFVKAFKRNQKKRTELFPQYSYMLLHSFEIAEKRYNVFLEETNQLHEAFDGVMPDHIVEKIAYYLCLDKLERCQHDYYMALHASLKNTKTDKAKIL